MEMNCSHPPSFNIYNTSKAYCPQTQNRNVGFRKYGVQKYNQNYQFNRKTYEKLEHWCETCDRGFYTEQQLIIHKQEHQKCNIDGCQFVAHPKVITKHIQMQHATELYNKISRLNTPEEIQKWKEERKIKYPTKENIARKAAEISEKLKRGERMELQKHNSKYANVNKKKFGSKNNYRPRKKKNVVENDVHVKNTLQKSKRKEFTKSAPISKNQSNTYHRLKPFTGIQDLIMIDEDSDTEEQSENALDIDDNEWTENFSNMSHQKQEESTSCNALANLICIYSSDSEPEGVLQTTKCPLINQESTENAISDKRCKTTLSDDSGPEEVKIEKKELDIVNDGTKHQKEVPRKQSQHNTKLLGPKYTKSKLPSTLLQKLLYKEMRHERNVTLQCIRYIINNNYFSDHSNK